MFPFKKDKLKNVETENINEIDLETKEEKKLFKVLNIILIIILVVATLISVDIIVVSKYQKGPFFALRTKVYKDGGTKVYYGLGYKVIKYHQIVGRRDWQIGFWTMKYNTKPTSVSTLDLALELRNDPKNSFEKYQKKFLKVDGKIDKINTKKKELILRYIDEDKKYSLDLVCSMEKNNKKLKKGDYIEVIGTIESYTIRNSKEKSSVNTLKMVHCFAK